MIPSPTHNTRSTRIFFAIVIAFQLLLIFQGVDFSDEGFLATFYQNIFDHPGSVQYNFMFWFTGVIGGIFYKLTQPIGLIGLRLAGVLVVTTTAWATFKVWKGRIGMPALMTGIALVLVDLNNDIKIVNYNTLSALFFVLVVLLLLRNLERPKATYLILAGFLVAMNTFVRLPNILGISLLAMPLLAPGTVREKTRAAISMGTGLLLGVATMFLLLRITGQTGIFLNAFDLVREMSQAKPQKGIVGGNYGWLKILTQFRSDILHSLLYTLLLLSLLGAVQFILAISGRRPGISRFATLAVTILFPLAVVGLIMTGQFRHFSSLSLYHGAGMLAVLLVLHRKMPLDIQFISFAGLLILMFYPVGSAQGILTAGKYCLWITTPIAVDILAGGMAIRIPERLRAQLAGLTGPDLFPAWTRAALRNAVIAAFMVFGLYYSFKYPFFDYGNRLAMSHGVKNSHMRFIGTTRERSDAVNDLLKAADGVIAPGDTVLAYDCLPLFHFMTGTTPYLHNSYPWLYSSEAFAKDLAMSSRSAGMAPVVVCQKIQTIGDGGGWPTQMAGNDYAAWDVNAARNRTLKQYLEANGYRVYWESPYFQILTPAGYHPIDTARK
jgi:hypothetical protein